MASEIRVNKIANRAGLSTVEYTDTGIIVSGIVTCTEISGLNALNIAGVSTFASPLDINGSIDVDGHTELDNTNIVGILTVTNVTSGTGLKLIDASSKQFAAGGGGGGSPFAGSQTGHDFRIQVGGTQNAIFKYAAGGTGNLELGPASGIGITFNGATGNAVYAGIVTASSYRGDGSQLTGISVGPGTGESYVILRNQSNPPALSNTGANTIIGHNAAHKYGNGSATGGNENLFVGKNAGYTQTGGDGNVFLGAVAGYSNATSGGNTYIGHEAGRFATGANNVIIGRYAGKIGGFSGSNNTVIGQNSNPSSASVSNEITLGDTNISHFRIPGIGVSFGNNGAVIAGVVTATSFSGDGSSLSNLPASAPVGGASTNTVFFENDVAVAVNYQVTTNKNAMSAGPIAINAGIAVTVPSGSSWTIV